jgi:heme oxygenase (biliverdin-producing, ferredoxin)
MNNLKELTKEFHTKAEKTAFVKRMLKKELTPHQYYTYLSNQLLMYYHLEHCAEDLGILDDLKELPRYLHISRDMTELETEHGFKLPTPAKATLDYIEYIDTISSDADKLLAHIYVRHMGDLSGGQIIKRFVPGSGNFYQFDEDVSVLKDRLREKLHDGLADEAINCFKMMINFMEELEAYLDLGPAY